MAEHTHPRDEPRFSVAQVDELLAEARAEERAKVLAQLTDEATNARVIDAAARVLDEPAFIEREAGSRSARRVARLNARAALSAAVNRFQQDITKGQGNG